MTRTQPVQNTWSSGEIDPALWSRNDFQRYQTGLRTCRGFIPMRQGGVTRAPGTIYRGRTRASDISGNDLVQRRIPFIFAANDAVELEFTSNTMRVWRYGALVIATDGEIYDLQTPFIQSDLPNLRYAQDGDSMIIVDGRQPVQLLQRKALNDWTLTPARLNNGPYRVQNLNETSQIQASVAFGVTELWQFNTQVTVGDLRRVEDRVYELTAATEDGSPINEITTSFETPSHLSGSEVLTWEVDNGQNTTTFTATWLFKNQPAAAETTLTGSGNPFKAGHVGALFRMEPTSFQTVAPWVQATAASVGDLFRFDGNIYRMVSGNNTGNTAPTHKFGTQLTEISTDTRFEFVSDNVGIVRITDRINKNRATAEIIKTIPEPIRDAPTWRWSEAAWSEIYGYPSTVTMHGAQLVAANSEADPRNVWASTDQAILDFEPSAEADGSFAYTLRATGSKNEILWVMSGNQGLYIGTLGEVVRMFSTDPGKGLGPTNVDTERVSISGVADADPVAPYGFPVYISRDKRRIFESRYSFQTDGHEPIELTLPSQHLGASPFEQIVWKSAPSGEIWVRRADGTVIVGRYEPAQDILGWAPVPMAGGFVEDMAVSPSADGSTDIITFVVRRTIDGETRRCIEEQADNRASELGVAPISHFNHAFASAVFEPGAATDTFSVPHLVGQSVMAWTDKGQYGPYTVPGSGQVVLDNDVSRAVIGLFDDTHQGETLNIPAATQGGDARGRRRRLEAATGVEVKNTAGGFLQAIEDHFETGTRAGAMMHILRQGLTVDTARDITGTGRIGTPTGYADQVRLRFLPDGLMPMTLTALIPVINEEGA